MLKQYIRPQLLQVRLSAASRNHSDAIAYIVPLPRIRLTSDLGTRTYRRQKSTAARRPFSFAFDIDGVLLKSSRPIPGATEALNLLKKHNVPFILLTNGGGLHENDRVANLTKHLGTSISREQFIQSHTPFQFHARDKGYKNILVCGGILDTCRYVAKDYGFPHVTLPIDYLATDPSIWPYHQLSESERRCSLPLPPANDLPIDAIYVFHDPRDWGLDSQIIMDVLLSRKGAWGTRQLDHQDVPIYFSNPDLLWANAFQFPRFGQGAFQILVEGLYVAVTGRPLRATTIGKPSRVTYAYAEKILDAHQNAMRDGIGGRGAGGGVVPLRAATATAATSSTGERGTVYMVGDNKLSDIQGANDFGWESILVRTGVFSGTTEEGCSGEIPARHCVRDVKEAVQMVLAKEGIL